MKLEFHVGIPVRTIRPELRKVIPVGDDSATRRVHGHPVQEVVRQHLVIGVLVHRHEIVATIWATGDGIRVCDDVDV